MKKMFVNSLNNRNPSNYLSMLLPIIIALITTFLIRFPMLMELPSTDQGLYAFWSQINYAYLSQGKGLVDFGTLMLYPALTSWVFSFDGNHIMLLRLFDLFIAVIASIIFFYVIKKESGGSSVIATILSIAALSVMNHKVFISSGFNNQFFAAYIPLFIAYLMSQSEIKNKYSWFYIGGLLSLAVLLRETLLPFFIVAGASILYAHGKKITIDFSLGAACVGFPILVLIFFLRGDFFGLFTQYIFSNNYVYSYYDPFKFEYFLRNFLGSIKIFWFIASAAFLTLLLSIKFEKKGKVLFWVLIALVPLIEPLLKVGFPYHFSVCILGLTGLIAYGCSYLPKINTNRNIKYLMTIFLIASLYSAYPSYSDSNIPRIKAVIQDLGQIRNKKFESGANEYSQYLTIAAKINENYSMGSTLASSGLMHVIYPLTGLLPPSRGFADMAELLFDLDFNEDIFIEKLKKSSPDIILCSQRDDRPIMKNLKKAIEKSGLYNRVFDFKKSDKHYGWQQAILYEIKEK